MSPQRAGLIHGAVAFALWGVAPAYWKLLAEFDAVELIAHRVLWGLVTFALIAALVGKWSDLLRTLRDKRALAMMALSSTLLAINWSVFIAATLHGYLIEASLGYFINPLISIALGTILLRERMRRLQWIASSLAIIGVAIITWHAGRVPWVALVLAVSWGFYGLVRKTVQVEHIVGSTLETLILAPIAIGYLVWLGGGGLAHADPGQLTLLVSTGVVTAIPLVLFTSAARKLPLSTIGFLQFLAPSGQFLLAVLAYGEPFSSERLLAFAWIWVGLVVFSIDLALNARPQPAP
jgi:chloramphenicol-sensitive protein RarD